MRRITALITLLLITGLALQAKVTVANICKDGMVLQQNSHALIWGTASPDAQVSVIPSWNGTSYKGKADDEGRWEIRISTPPATYKPYSITVKGDGSNIRINDVLIGEVWLASGQSNMQMPMKGYFNNPTENSMEYICAPAATDKIRMFTVPLNLTYELQNEVDAQWLGAESTTIPDMSAVAYFFAYKLNQMLDVPVGIISCSYGGTRHECWVPRDVIETYPDEKTDKESLEAMPGTVRASYAYNAMLYPIKGYSLKGFIWYQGCSNVGRHEDFVERMNNLILRWREDWNDTDNELPFYMVEIAPFNYNRNDDAASYLRLAQHETAATVRNCGTVVTNDLVEPYEQNNIHPAKKKEIGDRLAYMALNRNYGFNAVLCDSQQALNCTLTQNPGEIAVEIANCPNGMNRWAGIKGLEIAGDDGVFYPVENAYLDWYPRVMKLKSDSVPQPTQVRYGWGDFNPGNLKSAEGLPVAPFWIKLDK